MEKENLEILNEYIDGLKNIILSQEQTIEKQERDIGSLKREIKDLKIKLNESLQMNIREH